MEDDFSKLWADYSQKIPKIEPQKEQLAPFLRLRGRVETMRKLEWLAMLVLPCFCALVWGILYYYGLENGYKMAANLLLIISVLELILQFYKIRIYNQLNYQQNTLSSTLKMLDKLQKWLVMERVFSVFFTPLVVLLLLPFARFVLYGENLFEDLDFYLLLGCCALLLGGILSWFLYQRWLIRLIQALRAELEALRD